MTGCAAAPAALALALALAVAAGCGGGGGKSATSTSTPTSVEDTTSSDLPTTTSTTIDPALKDLLLVAADLPTYKEATNPSPDAELFKTCDPSEAPAVKAIYDAPRLKGSSFVRGADDAVEVASSVNSITAEQAEAGLTEIQETKGMECLQKDLQALFDKDKPADSTVTVKVATSKSTLSSIDQAVVLGITITTKEGATTTVSRQDSVFLRVAGTILVIDYGGPSGLTSQAERQRIVAIAAKKLAATNTASSTSTTEAGTGSGSSTSSTRRTSTTRRSTTTSRSGSTSSSRSTSTTV